MQRVKGRRGKGKSRERRQRRARASGAARVAPYEFLDHPADVGFRARGRTLGALFANATRALCDCGWQRRGIRPRDLIRIRVRAASLEDLLFSWLAEVLFLADAEKWVFARFRRLRVAEQRRTNRSGEPLAPPGAGAPGLGAVWEAEGEARGERFAPARHRARTYIKAVTYHQLSVRETRAGWEATVYLDV